MPHPNLAISARTGALICPALALLEAPAAAQGGMKSAEPAEDAEIGYDAGFDFETLGVTSNSWRIGRTYFEESLLTGRMLDAAIDALLD